MIPFDFRTTTINRFQSIRDSESLAHYVITVLAVAAVYVVMAKLGLSFADTTKQISVVWPPSGIVLAFFLIKGFRYAPGVLLGAFIVNFLAHEPFLVASSIAVGNTLEGLAAAYLFRYFFPEQQVMGKIINFLGFVVLAVLLSPVIAATIGVASLAMGGLLNASAQSAWLTWWTGDVMGILILTPFILSWLNPVYRATLLRRPYEAVLLFLSVISVTLLIFCFPDNLNNGFIPLPYLVFPFMTWAAVRFQQIGVVTSGLLVSAVSIWATTRSLGPFDIYGTSEESLIMLQLFVAVALTTGLILSMSVYQHLLVEEALKQKTFELQKSKIEGFQSAKWRHSLEDQITEAKNKITSILNEVVSDDIPKKK